MATEKKTVKLDPDQFSVDESGKVTINSERLADIVRDQTDEIDESGSVKVEVSISVEV